MADEIQSRYEFVDSKLRGDTTLFNTLGLKGIWPGRALDDADYPLIQHHSVTGEDQMVSEGRRIWNGGLHDVEVIGGKDASYDDISPIVSRVDDLLHNQQFVSTTNGYVESCIRRRVFDIPYDIETGLYPRRILRFEFITQ